MRNGKVDPKMIETDSALKARPGKHGPDQGWSVKKTLLSVLTSVFIILSYFTLSFYRRNHYYSSLEEEIVLTAVYGNS